MRGQHYSYADADEVAVMTTSQEVGLQEEEKDGAWVDSRLMQEVLGPEVSILGIDVQRATGKGDNFLGIIYRARVQYRSPCSDGIQERTFIVKGLPEGDFIQDIIQDMGSFDREILVYKTLPFLYAFADSRLKDRTYKRFAADLYQCSRPDTLVFDDLREQGFVMLSRRDRLDLHHSKLVVQQLARFHALSVAYAEEHPDFFPNFPDKVYCENNMTRMKQFFSPSLKSICQEIRKWGGFSNIADKLEGRHDEFVERVVEILHTSCSYINVLIHGDCWVNNLMFKYEGSTIPSDFRFLDFQITRVSSPAVDLIYFLFSSPKKHVRQNQMEELLREYCDEFTRSTHELGYRGKTIGYKDIRREMDRLALFGFMCMLSIMPVVLTDPEKAPDFSAITEEQLESGEYNDYARMYGNPEFREGVIELLPYFDKLGAFD